MTEIQQLLAILDQAYDRPSWHGTNLRGSIRRVSARQAAWRPGPKRHNIWEIVVHAAYWKYAAARRFTGDDRGSFPLKGSNWFARPTSRALATDRVWREDVALLDRMHDTLRHAVSRLSSRDLAHTPPGKKVSNFALLAGIAAHDLYHAGQIQLLKRLMVSQ
jgi:DinB superfamily